MRVDLPVWFGTTDASQKIVVLGMEPRDTDKTGALHNERVEQFVFATPFAIERPRGPYFSAFKEFLAGDAFVYFTDVVKSYSVSGNKAADDKTARINFVKNAGAGKRLLLGELAFIKPTLLVALGNQSYFFLKELLEKAYPIQKVRHPSQGGARLAREQLKSILI